MKSRGFTLIELLVVIAIIAILSVLGFLSYNRIFGNARDSRRKNDLRELQTAIESYYTDHYSYPDTGGEWWGACAGFGDYELTGANAYIPDIEKYMDPLPEEPRPFARTELDASCNSADVSCFIYRSDGESYKLVSNCGIETTAPTVGKPFYDPARPAYGLMVCSKDLTACRTW